MADDGLGGMHVKYVYHEYPARTPSMRTALVDLKLDHLYVLYPGDKTYSLRKNVEVVPLAKFVKAK